MSQTRHFLVVLHVIRNTLFRLMAIVAYNTERSISVDCIKVLIYLTVIQRNLNEYVFSFVAKTHFTIENTSETS